MSRGVFVRRIRFRRGKVSLLKRVLILLLCLCLVSFIYIELQVRPKIFSLAAIKAEVLATEAIDMAVLGEIENLNITYQDLMNVEYKDDNSIGGLSSNILGMNKLKASVTLSAQDKITQLSQKEIAFAMGDLSGFTLLSGRGPNINVKLNYAGSIKAEFENSFESAGMNQTLHSIQIRITAHLSITSRNMEENIKIETNIPVAETVIVGSIPTLYAARNT